MEELTILNPFVVGRYVSDRYFCDREKETEFLMKQIANGRNTVLVSFRRMGKTGLISHLFGQKSVKESYNTVFVDIYASSSLTEFVYLLGKAIFEQIQQERHSLKQQFFQIIKSMRIGFKMDPLTGEAGFDLGLGNIETPVTALDEIFEFLESVDKPCVVAIDEFQQIAMYQEQNVEALLRSKIQQCRKTVFIFSGSKRHLMYNMFNSSAKPFYQSAVSVALEAIPLEKYLHFVENLFEERGKAISPAVVQSIYERFDGTTWYIQMMMNELFALTGYGECCSEDKISLAWDNIIQMQDGGYRMLLSQIPYKQKQLLQAIAKEGKVNAITSGNFVNRHSLPSASSTQAAAKMLLKKEIITQEGDCYWIYDYFFSEWLKRNF